jgi:exodeoxyribonuclease VII small subunit
MEQMNYEIAFRELKEIATEIEHQTITVDLLADKVKRAALLMEYCQKSLRSTEDEVSRIIAQLQQEK